MKTISYVIFKPGGNDTALILGIEKDPNVRKEINDAIMQKHPNVEQVGFINEDIKNPVLQMAGGEFCGNATRSTAWFVLDGQKGDLEIQVSGVEGKLKAGVIQEGEAYAQMPIHSDPTFITPDPDNVENFTVEMEGITHYIEFDTKKIEGLSDDQIKNLGMDEIRKRNLDTYPAAGVIYAKQTENGWSITPIVYVRDIKTEFLETGCGSGTTALGMVLALKEKKSIENVAIYQPSGLPINVSVTYQNNEFIYAQISGPVQKLYEGSLEM